MARWAEPLREISEPDGRLEGIVRATHAHALYDAVPMREWSRNTTSRYANTHEERLKQTLNNLHSRKVARRRARLYATAL
jgi:hypothetical protein